jgi:NAD(P)-dependent dehydrogenase (short-subunit alcohol dehydrogenase family)
LVKNKIKRVAIFGAKGNLGSYLLKEITPFYKDLTEIVKLKKQDAIIWTQGANLTKRFIDTDVNNWNELWEANVGYIVNSLRECLRQNKINKNAKLIIIGSIWQNISRNNKSAYLTTKSALTGLVRSLASELGSENISVNAILPGVIFSPMTLKNLTKNQIQFIQKSTPNNKLVNLQNISNWVKFLISDNSSGLNGQSIVIDNGWSLHRDL